MGTTRLLHGSERIVKHPDKTSFDVCNDFGPGFYCAKRDDTAREWACRMNTDGFVNIYECNTDGLKALNLLDGKHTVLNWVALLLGFRTFSLDSDIAADAKAFLTEYYSPDLTGCDIVTGWKADDTYFRYAELFVSNAMPLGNLVKALKLGRPSEQSAVISKKGLDRLMFADAYPVNRTVYYPRFLDRDKCAREAYLKATKKENAYLNDLFMLDILREEMKGDDPRIQRALSK